MLTVWSHLIERQAGECSPGGSHLSLSQWQEKINSGEQIEALAKVNFLNDLMSVFSTSLPMKIET